MSKKKTQPIIRIVESNDVTCDLLVVSDGTDNRLEIILPTKERQQREKGMVSVVTTKEQKIELVLASFSMNYDEAKLLMRMLQDACAEVAAWEADQ